MGDAALDKDQSIRIQKLEEKVLTIEVSLGALKAQISQATQILKVVAVGMGLVLGIDLQGAMV
jgi:hypothetical protein